MIVGISNQGGCAAINPNTGKPRKTIENTIAEMQFTLSLFPELSDIYFCPDFKGEDCWRVLRTDAYEIGTRETQLIGQFRKPDAGMLKLVKLFVEDGNWVVTEMMMVGDRSEDKTCASAMGCKFMWAENWRKEFSNKKA